jgi:hypothetical protein
VNSFLGQFRGIIVACGTFFCLAQIASAQGLGTISGTIVDQTGASVASASVILTEVKTGATVTVQSHADGLYVFPSVSPADYRVAPLRTLVGFEKLRLRRAETTAVQLTITPRQLSVVAPDGTRRVQAGDYEPYVGGSQPSHDGGIFLPFRVDGSSAVEP